MNDDARQLGVDARVRRARALIELGRPRDAIPELQRALAERPENTEIFLALSAAHRAIGELDVATDFAHRAASTAPEDYWPRIQLTEIFLAQNRIPEAVDAGELATALAPEAAEGFYFLAEALIRAGRIDEARQAEQNLTRLAPDEATSHDTLGRIELGLGRPDKAEKHFRRALKVEPESVPTMNNLGTSLLEQRRSAEAASVFWTAARMRPLNSQIRMNLGIALSRLDMTGASILAFMLPMPVLLIVGKLGWIEPESVPFVSYYVGVFALFAVIRHLRHRKLETELREHLGAQSRSNWRSVLEGSVFVGAVASFFHGIYLWMWWNGGSTYAPGSLSSWALFVAFTSYVTLCWIRIGVSIYRNRLRRRRALRRQSVPADAGPTERPGRRGLQHRQSRKRDAPTR